MDQINPEDLIDFSPKDIVETLFTKPADEPNKNLLLLDQSSLDAYYIYEILLSILLEALDKVPGGLKNYDTSKITEDSLLYFNPWFKSLGFKIFVDKYELIDKDLYTGYYCKVIINNKIDSTFFELNSITDQSYYFLLNGSCIVENQNKENIKDIFSIYRIGDCVYTIRFDCYIG